jgi:hypothetical protein
MYSLEQFGETVNCLEHDLFDNKSFSELQNEIYKYWQDHKYLTSEFLVSVTRQYCANLFAPIRHLQIFNVTKLAESCRPSLIKWIEKIKEKKIIRTKEELQEVLLMRKQRENGEDVDNERCCEWELVLQWPMIWEHYPVLKKFANIVQGCCKGGINGDCLDDELYWNEDFHVQILNFVFDVI